MNIKKSIKVYKTYGLFQKKDLHKFLRLKNDLIAEIKKLNNLRKDLSLLLDLKESSNVISVSAFCSKRDYTMRLKNESKIIDNKIEFLQQELLDVDGNIKNTSNKKDILKDRYMSLEKKYRSNLLNKEG